MAELYDEDIFLGDSNVKPFDGVPEMLDYDYVANCESADELRAILKALKSGEFGKYPDLENTARTKLVELLPENEKRKIIAMTAKPSVTDVNSQRKNLQEWLGDVSQSDRPSGFAPGAGNPGSKKSNPAPVRAVARIDLGSNDTTDERSASPRCSEEEAIFRKEKLSTREYFDRWDKFDVDEALESDDEAEIKRTPKKQPKEKKDDKTLKENEISQLQENLAELTLAERKFMSVREREKGNEYFNSGEKDEAIHCYSKSILLDGSNAKSYANLAAASDRRSGFDRAIENCTKASEIDPTFLKALARRGMCYHKSERYEDAIVDFKACHEAKSDAGYDRLLQRSKEKLHARSKKFHTMVIDEVDDSSVSNYLDNDEEEYDYIEEMYTPGALETKQQQQQQESKHKVSLSSFSTHSKAHFPKSSSASDRMKADGPTQDNNRSSMPTTNVANLNRTNDSQMWHKISIVETSDSEEDTVQVMKRINIVEETDSEGDEEQDAHVSLAQREDSLKLKEEGNDAMMHHRYDDAVKFYSLALDVNPNNTDVLNNRSIAYIKLKDWEKSIFDANSCLKIEPNNAKALYRRGFGKMMQSRNEPNMKEALDDFQLALSFNPPKEQRAVLSKKATECEKILSSMKESQDQNSKASEKKNKNRRHDTQALAF